MCTLSHMLTLHVLPVTLAHSVRMPLSCMVCQVASDNAHMTSTIHSHMLHTKVVTVPAIATAVCNTPPTNPANGTFSCSATSYVGTVCSATCSEGFVGSPTAPSTTCGPTGVWGTTTGACVRGKLAHASVFARVSLTPCCPQALSPVVAHQQSPRASAGLELALTRCYTGRLQ